MIRINRSCIYRKLTRTRAREANEARCTRLRAGHGGDDNAAALVGGEKDEGEIIADEAEDEAERGREEEDDEEIEEDLWGERAPLLAVMDDVVRNGSPHTFQSGGARGRIIIRTTTTRIITTRTPQLSITQHNPTYALTHSKHSKHNSTQPCYSYSTNRATGKTRRKGPFLPYERNDAGNTSNAGADRDA